MDQPHVLLGHVERPFGGQGIERQRDHAGSTHQGRRIALDGEARQSGGERVGVSALVKLCGTSESTLLRAFRRAHGLAPTEYLRKLDPEAGKAKYKNVNSAQPIPEKQG